MVKLLDFRDKEGRTRFDHQVMADPHSFVQQTTLWADIVSPLAKDIPVYFTISTKDYYISASLYLFKNKIASILVSNVQAGSLGCFTYIGPATLKPVAYKSIIEEILKFAENNNCLTVTLTSNPYARDEEVIRENLDPETGMDTFISVINIGEYFDEDGKVTYKEYNRRSNLSRNIKKSYQNGFVFSIDNSPGILGEWYETLHTKRIKELNGTPLPFELFNNIYNSPYFKDSFNMFIVRKNGQLISGDLCIFNTNGNFDNFMMSSDSRHLEAGVNFYLVDHILRWCYENGMKIYNWQSSNPPQGGIFEFKKRWGSSVLPYKYLCKILHKNEFEEIRGKYDMNQIFEVFQGHFFVPFQTLKAGIYKILNKEEINRIANIYN